MVQLYYTYSSVKIHCNVKVIYYYYTFLGGRHNILNNHHKLIVDKISTVDSKLQNEYTPILLWSGEILEHDNQYTEDDTGCASLPHEKQ